MAPGFQARGRALLEEFLGLTGVARAAEVTDTLIDRRGSLAAILSSDSHFIASIAGDRAAMACRVAHRMLTHTLQADLEQRPVLERQEAVVSYLKLQCGHAPTEQLRVLYLDSKHHLLNQLVFPGTIDSASMGVREIMARGLEVGAAGLVLAHNHPSGITSPSEADRLGTRRVVEAGRHLGIVVHDHLIITRNGHFSFRAEGLV